MPTAYLEPDKGDVVHALAMMKAVGDGEFVRPLALGHQGGGGFAGTLSGVADAAHGQVPVAGRVDFGAYAKCIPSYYVIYIIVYQINLR